MLAHLGILLGLVLSSETSTVVRPPRDVLECLMSLPADMGPFRGLPVEARRRALKESSTVVDQRNGFISFKTDWIDGGWFIQVAIFQRKDRARVPRVLRR